MPSIRLGMKTTGAADRGSARRSVLIVGAWLRQPLWNRFTPLQCVVLIASTLPPMFVGGVVVARLFGLIDTEAMREAALLAGEHPGMYTFAAMLLASPVQWATGRTQIRVRKYLGIMFFLLAVSNGAMFVVEQSFVNAFWAYFMVAGVLSLVLSVPLFLTSSNWSQRKMGMARWKRLHKTTYIIAVLLMFHVFLNDEILELSIVAIGLALIPRIPRIRTWLTGVGTIAQRDRIAVEAVNAEVLTEQVRFESVANKSKRESNEN